MTKIFGTGVSVIASHIAASIICPNHGVLVSTKHEFWTGRSFWPEVRRGGLEVKFRCVPTCLVIVNNSKPSKHIILSALFSSLLCPLQTFFPLIDCCYQVDSAPGQPTNLISSLADPLHRPVAQTAARGA